MTTLKTGVVYNADNLHQMTLLPAESVDLVYFDPPFFSNRQHASARGPDVRTFDDRWHGGIQSYLNWMLERVTQIRRLLKSTGSLYLHCDWHASHYLKVMLDDVFGEMNFLNNIVWCYGLGGSSSRYWPRKHDDILLYSKETDLHYFNPPLMRSSSSRMQGRLKKVVDYWEIPAINNMAHERVGYPTQKPEALLARIIAASSREGDVILDPCCGSGTTLAVAQQMDRLWVGIDNNPDAVALTKERLGRDTQSSLFVLTGNEMASVQGVGCA